MRFSVLVVVLCASPVVACDDGATIQDRIITTQILGTADDGDSATPADSYKAPGDYQAEDGATRATSDPARFDRVGGMVDAHPTDPSAGALEADEARATSFNKVVSALSVASAGPYTFDVALTLTGIEIVHEGRLRVSVRGALLDGQGRTVPGGGFAFYDAEIRPDPQGGPPQVVVQPQPVGPNGTFTAGSGLSGPPGGIQLARGDYQLELDLRLFANAPIVQRDDGRKDRAKIDQATAVMSVR